MPMVAQSVGTQSVGSQLGNAYISGSGQTGLAGQGSGQGSQFNIDEIASEKVAFNEAMTQAAKAVIAYATRLRPIANPDEFMAIVDATLENCALSTIQRIDPQTGRLRSPGSTGQALQAQAQMWRQMALQATGQQATGQGDGQSGSRGSRRGNGRTHSRRRSQRDSFQNFGYQGVPLSLT